MMKNRKGMTMALGVIIAIVVLIVVALAVIAITSGTINLFGGQTSKATGDAGNKIVGATACTDCGWRETKDTTSEIDDIIHRNPYYCEDASAVQYCCEDLALSHCVQKANCAKPFIGTAEAETACTPA